MKRYFDYAATCPLDEDALNAYVHAARNYFANSSSLHDPGSKAKQLLEHCRRKMAELLLVEEEGVYFTSGGTESNEIGLQALLDASQGKHIVTTDAEHSSVRNLMKKYQKEGYLLSKVPLTTKGMVDMKAFEQVVCEDTAIVAIQHVNAEIGTIQPIRSISAICRERGILLHSDCVQTFGKVDLSEVAPYVDSLSVSSHKVFGPKGVGAVYVRPALSFMQRIPGSTHESGVRPGTINIPGIAGFTVAAEKMVNGLEDQQQLFLRLKQTFLEEMKGKACELIGEVSDNPVPIIGLCLTDIEGQWAMLEGNRRGFHFSTGSACGVQSTDPPATLLAMGLLEPQAKTFIRISFGHEQTASDVEELARFLTAILRKVEKV
ncbi:cysteine desulfurase [Halobacillus dabanensis]|uniref:Cysteine desulfurase n=1 Tax=Halobacillus dabanensis TaxID=240302 RepID=A0A1I3ZQE1_HALDA|nr:IscS subfamily cysteine desulfurase [Halobacillus dabanensis]SFK46100.1 cysteine desulfurase [Halobacillus dabanensis]